MALYLLVSVSLLAVIGGVAYRFAASRRPSPPVPRDAGPVSGPEAREVTVSVYGEGRDAVWIEDDVLSVSGHELIESDTIRVEEVPYTVNEVRCLVTEQGTVTLVAGLSDLP